MYFLPYFTKRRIALMIVLWGILCGCIALSFHSAGYDIFTSESYAHLGLNFFYRMQTTTVVLLYFIINIFLAPNLLAADLYRDRKTHFSNFIKVRIGSRRYFYHSIAENYLTVLLYFICTQLVALLFIHFFLFPIIFDFSLLEGLYNASEALSANHVWNLILFIFLSANGYAIFATLLFSLRRYLRDVYLFRASGLILGVLLYILPVFFYQFLSNCFPMLSQSIFYLFSVLYFPTLIAPGVEEFGQYLLDFSPVLAFLISYAICGGIAVWLNYKADRREYRYE